MILLVQEVLIGLITTSLGMRFRVHNVLIVLITNVRATTVQTMVTVLVLVALLIVVLMGIYSWY